MFGRPLSFVILAICAVVAVGVIFVSIPEAAVEQPVAYPHAKHIDLNIACVACHTGALEGSHAGIPRSATCALCHKAELSFPPTPPELAALLQKGEEIPWKQVHIAPRHVYFSHRRHAGIAKIDCVDCHGDVKTMEAPFARRKFAGGTEGMARCVACHRKENVTTDCLSCHR